MNTGRFFELAFEQILPTLPTIFVTMIGVVVSLIYLGKARRAAVFGLLGFGLFLAMLIAGPFAFGLVREMVMSSPSRNGWAFTAYGVAHSLFEALGLLLLLFAAFSGRKSN